MNKDFQIWTAIKKQTNENDFRALFNEREV